MSCLLGSNLSEFPHHQLLLQWCYHAIELSRSLRNVSKAVIFHQDILEHKREPQLTLTTKKMDSRYFQCLFLCTDATQNISCLIYSTHYVTTSWQLCDASKILKSEACISRLVPKVCVVKRCGIIKDGRCLEIFTSLIAAMNQGRINPRKRLRKT